MAWRAMFLATASFALSISPAWADPATHVLQLKARDAQGEMIAPGRYDRMCLVEGQLRSLGTATPELSVVLWYREHPGLDPGQETSVSLTFDPLAAGASSEWVQEHEPGMSCRGIRPHRVEVVCRPRCGFVHVAVPAFRTFRLRAERITARNDR